MLGNPRDELQTEPTQHLRFSPGADVAAASCAARFNGCVGSVTLGRMATNCWFGSAGRSGPLANLRRILRCTVYGPILSRNGASGEPGAIH